MAQTRDCSICNGSGSIEYLISQHGDETESGTCRNCRGVGEVHYMTDEEEEDYKRNNDW